MSNQGASRSGTLATLLCTHREKTGLTQRQLAGNGTSGLRVEVLGPLAVWRDGLPVPLGPVRQRAVLGLLILHAGTSVHRAAIIDALWGEDPPPTVVAMVHNHVSRIRRLVSGPPGGDVPLLWDGSGYRFIPGSIQLDVTQFGELTGQAEAQLAVGDAASACDLYERALALWRGQPLEDIEVLYAQPSVTKLGHWRDDVVIKYANAAARVGLHDRAIPHLEALTAREPLDERAHAQLMLALAATGRQAAALGVYQDLAGRLDTELGVRPGPESSAAHLRILREQVSPWAGAGSDDEQAAQRRVVPRQLPPPVPGFAGRAAELAMLTRLLEQAAAAGGTVVISAIGGTAGVGKTALAVHWAHQVAGEFPDGQLHVNLRGFGPAGRPMTAAEAVRLFLDGLGVPPDRIPAGLDAQAALYRSLLAGRKMLIVLDNAHDPEQVRPLLPGAPGCLVLVTSRNQLTGLAAADGALLLTLNVLTEADVRELMARRLGPERVAGEPVAVAELSRLCARLPLALSVAAAHAAARPRLTLAALAAELRSTGDPLDALRTGEAATDVRTVFSWSCQQLTAPAARMFRLLGVHPGPDITIPAAASLTGQPPSQARATLAELGGAHLVTERTLGRYACHDLLRAYAAEQAAAIDRDGARRAALHRVFDHYLQTAVAATALIHPFRDPVTLSPPAPGVCHEELTSRLHALEWFQAERQVLLAAIRQAAGQGFHRHAWQLPWAVATFLNWHGYWHELAATQESALTAAGDLGDLAGQAEAHRYLGQAQIRLGALVDATGHLEAALELFQRLGNRTAQARAHYDLAHICELRGRAGDALRHAWQALQLYRAAGHQSGEAIALNAVGWFHTQLGHYWEALDYSTQALAIHGKLGNRTGEADTLDSLGYAHHQLGHCGEAIACYQRAIEALGDADDLHMRAMVLGRLGDAHDAAGHDKAARDAWHKALAMLDGLNHPDAAGMRSRLSRPGA